VRYKAIIVQKDAYLLELSRYVVLNPVRAGMVKDLQEKNLQGQVAPYFQSIYTLKKNNDCKFL